MQQKKIWIDMVTAPDVPFFTSIVKECRRRGNFTIFITGRKYLEVPVLIEKYSLKDVVIVDCFYGKSKLGKVISLLVRTFQLCIFTFGKKIDLAFSFGSRSQTLAGWLCRIPVLSMFDYERAENYICGKFSTTILLPKEVPKDIFSSTPFTKRVIKDYPGLKESVYAYDFMPDSQEIIDAGVALDSVNIVLRLNSVLAHYHTGKSIEIDRKIVSYLGELTNVSCIILPRYSAQREVIENISKRNNRIRLLKKPVCGQNLIWHSDGVISGGGSMIREAVCLGVPAYDIFDGPIGRVEQALIDSGKVIKLESEADLEKIIIKKSTVANRIEKDLTLLKFVVDQL